MIDDRKAMIAIAIGDIFSSGDRNFRDRTNTLAW